MVVRPGRKLAQALYLAETTGKLWSIHGQINLNTAAVVRRCIKVQWANCGAQFFEGFGNSCPSGKKFHIS